MKTPNRSPTVTKAEFQRFMGWTDTNQRLRFAARFGVPCGTDPEKPKEPIDLIAVIKALAAFASQDDDESALLKKEKLRREIEKLESQIKALDADYQSQTGTMLRRDSIVEALNRMATIIRTAGDRLARKRKLTGTEAQAAINNALDQFSREVDQVRKG